MTKREIRTVKNIVQYIQNRFGSHRASVAYRGLCDDFNIGIHGPLYVDYGKRGYPITGISLVDHNDCKIVVNI